LVKDTDLSKFILWFFLEKYKKPLSHHLLILHLLFY
jgi:hypothetical protein